jgi:hypothetical protein
MAQTPKTLGRPPDAGDSNSINITVGAGLHDFLHRHAVRAILGKSVGEVAVRLITDQAIAYDRDSFLGVKLPTQDFPKPPGVASTPPTGGSPDEQEQQT